MYKIISYPLSICHEACASMIRPSKVQRWKVSDPAICVIHMDIVNIPSSGDTSSDNELFTIRDSTGIPCFCRVMFISVKFILIYLHGIISKEVRHLRLHRAVSVYQLHRLRTARTPDEVGAWFWPRGPGGVDVSSWPSEGVAQVPWSRLHVPEVTTLVTTSKAPIKRVVKSENTYLWTSTAKFLWAAQTKKGTVTAWKLM